MGAHKISMWLLTLVHESASVPPSAVVRYLPALQAVHTAAPLAENDPLAHCVHNNILEAVHAKDLKIDLWYRKALEGPPKHTKWLGMPQADFLFSFSA